MDLGDTFKNIVSAVAPVIGTALGGPLGGAAASQISQALLGKTDATKPEIEKAIQSATPEQLAALKKIDNDFQIKMQEMGLDVEKLNQANTANARAREIAVKDKIPAILAILVTIGFFATLYFVYADANAQSDALKIMLGSLGMAWASVMNYYFGSSSGSAKKNELLARAQGK